MGKRYYCDYCERSFKDDTEARKKHLSSLQHAKNRADHYSYYKDPATILKEERLKTLCKRFIATGECTFGTSCKFSHYAPFAIRRLEQMVIEAERAPPHPSHHPYRPNPREISEEYFGAEMTVAALSSNQTADRNEYPEWWTVPAPATQLFDRANLPLSLWPITGETVTDSDFGEWGFR